MILLPPFFRYRVHVSAYIIPLLLCQAWPLVKTNTQTRLVERIIWQILPHCSNMKPSGNLSLGKRWKLRKTTRKVLERLTSGIFWLSASSGLTCSCVTSRWILGGDLCPKLNPPSLYYHTSWRKSSRFCHCSTRKNNDFTLNNCRFFSLVTTTLFMKVLCLHYAYKISKLMRHGFVWGAKAEASHRGRGQPIPNWDGISDKRSWAKHINKHREAP